MEDLKSSNNMSVKDKMKLFEREITKKNNNAQQQLADANMIKFAKFLLKEDLGDGHVKSSKELLNVDRRRLELQDRQLGPMQL